MRFGTRRVIATITLADGSVQTSPDSDIPFDRLMFERKYGFEWLDWDEIREEYLCFMAWVQTRREQLANRTVSPDDFETWMLEVASIELDVKDAEGDDAALPTDSAASTT